MRKCELCHREMGDEFVFCPFCGEPQAHVVEAADPELDQKVQAILKGTHRRLQAVIGTFARYVEAPVTDSIISGDMKELAGSRHNLSVLLADIRNSSGIVARLEPEDALEFLSNHHDRCSAAVMDTGGIVDKFIGDGMLALYPRGEPQEHAIQALKAAMRIREYVVEANEDWHIPDIPLRVGVSINTGTAVVGSCGSRYRQDYTAIGAEINFVADLQEMTKAYGVDTLISEATYRLVKGDIDAEQVGTMERPLQDKPEPIYYVHRMRDATDTESEV